MTSAPTLVPPTPLQHCEDIRDALRSRDLRALVVLVDPSGANAVAVTMTDRHPVGQYRLRPGDGTGIAVSWCPLDGPSIPLGVTDDIDAAEDLILQHRFIPNDSD